MSDEALAQKLTGRKDGTPEQAQEMVNALVEAASLAESQNQALHREVENKAAILNAIEALLDVDDEHTGWDRIVALQGRIETAARYVGKMNHTLSCEGWHEVMTTCQQCGRLMVAPGGYLCDHARYWPDRASLESQNQALQEERDLAEAQRDVALRRRETLRENWMEALRRAEALQERAEKAEDLLRAVAFDDQHKLQVWLEPLYIREPYVKVLVDKATELLSPTQETDR